MNKEKQVQQDKGQPMKKHKPTHDAAFCNRMASRREKNFYAARVFDACVMNENGRCIDCGYTPSSCRNGAPADYAFMGCVAMITDSILKDGVVPCGKEVKDRYYQKLSEMLNCETKLVSGRFDDAILSDVPRCVKDGSYSDIETLHKAVKDLFGFRTRHVRKGATLERLSEMKK